MPGFEARLVEVEPVTPGTTVVTLFEASRLVDRQGRQVMHEGRPLRDPRLAEDGSIVIEAEVIDEEEGEV
ncbi:hypothetical protein [Mobilicoccus caccae]|nr:hypothetical protein [Mobilicoccus caccae]